MYALYPTIFHETRDELITFDTSFVTLLKESFDRLTLISAKNP